MPAAVQAALLKALGKDPDSPFGSNATAIGGARPTTGRGMLLGNPHFPWNGRYRFDQQQLTIPGQYDVAGASLIGSPVVNIGWNKERRLEPHRLDGVPVHAVRVPDGRLPHDVPDRERASSSSSSATCT